MKWLHLGLAASAKRSHQQRSPSERHRRAHLQVEPLEQRQVLSTVLAFRTPVGAVSIPAGQSMTLGTVDVHRYQQIRVVADERAGSASDLTIRLTITEGDELVAQLDTLILTPHSEVTRVYDVPGTTLTVFADASGAATGSDAADVLIYGFDPSTTS